jgi:glycosyltransferase involved in cell wall biosynthesis
MPTYSFVVPLYNEEETLPELVRRLTGVLDRLDGPADAILVDDGSVDRTRELLLDLAARDQRFKTISLTRNFGHQIAITAGLDHAEGDAVVILDGDLQDPPELVFDFIERWREGYEVVYGIRQDRTVEPLLRRTAIRLAYWVLGKLAEVEIPASAGDFRLVDRRALEQFRLMRESNRYVRGLFAWMGFRQIGVPYTRGGRYAGKTKYPLRRLVKLGADGLIGFSNVPLRVAMTVGFVVSGASFVAGIVAIVTRAFGVGIVPGWASVIVVVTFLGGVQLVVSGMMGLYVARVYAEVKGRPLYIVRETENFAAGSERAPLSGVR